MKRVTYKTGQAGHTSWIDSCTGLVGGCNYLARVVL